MTMEVEIARVGGLVVYNTRKRSLFRSFLILLLQSAMSISEVMLRYSRIDQGCVRVCGGSTDSLSFEISKIHACVCAFFFVWKL